MHDPPSLLYIAGIPASGKSHFGKWLEATHGYLHIDAELPGQFDAGGLHGTWDAALARTNARLFVDAVRALDRTIILNWGFPPAFFPFITSLRSAGFSPWWFDSDVSAARTAYCEAGRPPVSFDGQVASITAAWPAIQQMFARNIVRVLEADGSRIPPAEIFRIVRGSESGHRYRGKPNVAHHQVDRMPPIGQRAVRRSVYIARLGAKAPRDIATKEYSGTPYELWTIIPIH